MTLDLAWNKTRAFRVLFIGSLLLGLCLAGCSRKPPENVVLTLKRDGSYFYGTLVRRDDQSITVIEQSGAPRTFLMNELSGIHYGTADTMATPPSEPASVPTETAAPVIELPQGAVFQVRNIGFIDSCCVQLQDTKTGVIDATVKAAKNMVIPKGAGVTFTLRDRTIEDRRISLRFELTSVDFGDRHYLISSANGDSEPGAVVTFSGAKEGTPEAATRGTQVHVIDRSAIVFKAMTRVICRASK